MLGVYIIIRVKCDLLFSECQKCINIICNIGFDIKHWERHCHRNDDEEKKRERWKKKEGKNNFQKFNTVPRYLKVPYTLLITLQIIYLYLVILDPKKQCIITILILQVRKLWCREVK